MCMVCDYGAYFDTDRAANSNSKETVNVLKKHKSKKPKNPQTKQKPEKKCWEFQETLWEKIEGETNQQALKTQ